MTREEYEHLFERVHEAYHGLISDVVRLNNEVIDGAGREHEVRRRWEEEKVVLNSTKMKLEVAENEAERLRDLLKKAGENVETWKSTACEWEQRALEAESKEVALKKANDDLLVTNVTLETERDQARRTAAMWETASRETEVKLLLAQNEVAHWKDRYGSIDTLNDAWMIELKTWRDFGRALRRRLDDLPA